MQSWFTTFPPLHPHIIPNMSIALLQVPMPYLVIVYRRRAMLSHHQATAFTIGILKALILDQMAVIYCYNRCKMQLWVLQMTLPW